MSSSCAISEQGSKVFSSYATTEQSSKVSSSYATTEQGSKVSSSYATTEQGSKVSSSYATTEQGTKVSSMFINGYCVKTINFCKFPHFKNALFTDLRSHFFLYVQIKYFDLRDFLMSFAEKKRKKYKKWKNIHLSTNA